MKNGFLISVTLNASPAVLFKAWLSSKEHTAFSGSPARISAKKGGKFSAWDGYITGQTVALEPNRKIVQRWRTTEFPDGSPDSTIEITLKKVRNGTMLVLKHTDIPPGQAGEYKKGWKEFYFKPMKDYFASAS